MITVLFMGPLRERMGRSMVTLPARRTAREVWKDVSSLAGGEAMGLALNSIRVAINQQYSDWDTAISPGDVVAFIPPVSGGSGDSGAAARIDTAVTDTPIDVVGLLAQAASPQVGATCSFIGTIRDQTDGLDVVGLDYEAYRPMAETVLQKIAGEHARAHALTSLAIRHRVGSLAVGEVALAVVVAAPHREAAFAACRNVVEAIKADVPIWKREHFRSGARWVGSSEMEPREVG